MGERPKSLLVSCVHFLGDCEVDSAELAELVAKSLLPTLKSHVEAIYVYIYIYVCMYIYIYIYIFFFLYRSISHSVLTTCSLVALSGHETETRARGCDDSAGGDPRIPTKRVSSRV